VQQSFTIKEAAATLGVSPHTLRYYERADLLAPIARSENGHRRYSQADLDWLRFLLRLRSTGMPINKVLRYAELAARGESTVEARQQLLE